MVFCNFRLRTSISCTFLQLPLHCIESKQVQHKLWLLYPTRYILSNRERKGDKYGNVQMTFRFFSSSTFSFSLFPLCRQQHFVQGNSGKFWENEISNRRSNSHVPLTLGQAEPRRADQPNRAVRAYIYATLLEKGQSLELRWTRKPTGSSASRSFQYFLLSFRRLQIFFAVHILRCGFHQLSCCRRVFSGQYVLCVRIWFSWGLNIHLTV